MVFTGNTFTSNMATFGGAITINSPNMRAVVEGLEDTTTPGIVIKSNYFLNNMAYFSGNAVYIRNAMPKTNVTYGICGGVQISGNKF